MVFSGEQGADVALKHEVRLARALDGFCYLWVGSVDQCSNLSADLLLPGRKGIDVGINTRIGSRSGGVRLTCDGRQLFLCKPHLKSLGTNLDVMKTRVGSE
jgi:hypothetical protein